MQRTAERNQRENEATKKYRNTYKQAVAFCCQLLRAPSLSSSRNVSTVRNVCSVFHVVVIPCSSFSVSLSRLPSSSPFFLCFFRVHRSFFIIHCRCFFSFDFVMSQLKRRSSVNMFSQIWRYSKHENKKS
jgi:hypothetical protein